MTLVNSRMPIMLQAERMQRVETAIETIQARIATGQRFTAPSENPAAANRAALLDRLQSVVEANGRVIERTRTRLSLAETGIDSASQALMRLRELALLASNGTLGPADREVIATEVRGLRDQLLDLANVRDEAGRFLFAGSRDSAPAYGRADEDGPILWQGAGEGPGAEAAGIGGARVPRGPEVFGRDADGVFATVEGLLRALAEPDAPARATAMAESLAGLEAALDRMVTARARIGAGLGRLAAESERLAAARLDIATGLASTRGLDLTEAIAELQALSLTLAASQQAFAQIFRFSLFDRLG
jgi:flagellar hook-associated protein 3 FlgL